MPNSVLRGKTLRLTARFPVALLAFVGVVCVVQLAAYHQQSATPVLAAELQSIQLPKPDTTGGMPLMQALAHRQTTRAFADKPLPLQTL